MKSSITPVLTVLLGSTSAFAVDFKRDVQPILKAECYECHSEEADKEKGGYVFDNLERFAKDIGPGRTIEPGDLRNSHFFTTIVSPEDDSAHMPPEKTLSDKQIATIREWILAGAPLPGMTPAAATAPVTAPAPAAPAPAAAVAAAPQSWTNTEGKVIQATKLRLEGENVVLQMANGVVYNYPLSKLSPESQAQAKAGQ
ncbi:hypothetical protein FEM03_20310 [Phragmitibacter flavus]|uniref:Cytochrome C Planctomycete-type domain-containing protein n=1 Tax=Phragmitibacter flavus TaxID=2576071 RepID=A0A5R8KAR5_9BACT|nr:c-type cytochrome domain-containing protein [Phragmitibacter flavus]TLD69005.1 hypothetical protein FEM03_20310 [Phragmitibacter flavus]